MSHALSSNKVEKASAAMGTNQDTPSDERLEALEKALAGGLRFTNLLAACGQENARENTVLLHSLLEVLVSKGLVHVHEVEKRKELLIESLREEEARRPQIRLIETPDKYATDGAVIFDCAAHHPVCRGGCCTLWFALSVQDLDERILRWNYTYPYGIAQGEDGFCLHHDRATHLCNVYENRPLICRTFDCRSDKRIWVDFEAQLLNPELAARLEQVDSL
jgi:Fe-S-cluster containining protein